MRWVYPAAGTLIFGFGFGATFAMKIPMTMDSYPEVSETVFLLLGPDARRGLTNFTAGGRGVCRHCLCSKRFQRGNPLCSFAVDGSPGNVQHVHRHGVLVSVRGVALYPDDLPRETVSHQVSSSI